MAQHALLSPSASHRWINCAAAPRLEAGEEDRGSSFAAEGTLAHAYCARRLKKYLCLPTPSEDAEIAQLSAEYHTGEMDEHTEAYSLQVIEKLLAAQRTTPDARLLVETRLDFRDYVPESFGTADAIIIADGCIEVIDFKYGKGVKVDAPNNSQMMIYALGAVERFGLDYRIDRVRMTIVQPRLNHLSEWEITTGALHQWADEVLIPAARRAYRGDGEAVAGDWCKFCKVRGRCRALAERCTALAADHPDPRLLTFAEVAALLSEVSVVSTWAAGLEEFALRAALDGAELPGWKVVAGRSVRRIADPDSVAAALRGAGFDDALIYKPTELRSLTELERTAGKKQFATLCGQYVDKPKGKPTLAPLSDKRAAYNTAAADFEGIEEA